MPTEEGPEMPRKKIEGSPDAVSWLVGDPVKDVIEETPSVSHVQNGGPTGRDLSAYLHQKRCIDASPVYFLAGAKF